MLVWISALLFAASAMAGTMNLTVNQVLVTDYC